jgi:hypothetical protein
MMLSGALRALPVDRLYARSYDTSFKVKIAAPSMDYQGPETSCRFDLD